MVVGVSKKEEAILKEILKDYFDKYSFYYYGSRVRGDFNKSSDLDILIKGEDEFSLLSLYNIKNNLDLSDIPYVVNFTDFKNIENSFFLSIAKDMIKI